MATCAAYNWSKSVSRRETATGVAASGATRAHPVHSLPRRSRSDAALRATTDPAFQAGSVPEYKESCRVQLVEICFAKRNSAARTAAQGEARIKASAAWREQDVRVMTL